MLSDSSTADALFSRAKRSVLGLLFTHPDEAYHTRAIARAVGISVGAVQRELQGLAAAGILSRREEGRQVYYQANHECPIFPDLQSLAVKTMGVADVLRSALAGLAGRIQLAFIYGSMTRGEMNAASDVDVLIVGDVTFAEAVAALRPAQETLRREVNPSVYPPDEYCRKVAEGSHFLTSILREPHVFLIGGEHELDGLGARRLAD
jgi:uncharacterized protein